MVLSARRRLFVLAKQLSSMSGAQSVSVPSENKAGNLPASLAGDSTKSDKGLIVLQEWWGFNDQIKECGIELATKGKHSLVTLVPDLYRGKVTDDTEEAGHLMSNLDWEGAMMDVKACAVYLKSKGCKKVGVTGFCMGGALSMASAVHVKEIDAAIPFYGIPSKEFCDVCCIKIPLQCHFGEKDAVTGFSTPKEWQPLKKSLEENVKDLEFYTYDAGHAFTSKGGPNYNKDATAQAFSRLHEFLQRTLV